MEGDMLVIRMIEQECMRPIMTCITIGLILFEKNIGLCFGEIKRVCLVREFRDREREGWRGSSHLVGWRISTY